MIQKCLESSASSAKTTMSKCTKGFRDLVLSAVSRISAKHSFYKVCKNGKMFIKMGLKDTTCTCTCNNFKNSISIFTATTFNLHCIFFTVRTVLFSVLMVHIVIQQVSKFTVDVDGQSFP